MKIKVNEVQPEDYVSYTYSVWRGFNEWTPVKTGYRRVIDKVWDLEYEVVELTFEDSTFKVFADDHIVEKKQDWDKNEVPTIIDER